MADVLMNIWAFIALRREVSDRELMQQFYYDLDKDEMHRILRTLETMGIIKMGHKGDRVCIVYVGTKDKESAYGFNN